MSLAPLAPLEVFLAEEYFVHHYRLDLGFLWMGFPLVLCTVACKSFALGFTVAFIVPVQAPKGMVFCLAAHTCNLFQFRVSWQLLGFTHPVAIKIWDRLGKRAYSE